jgi:L,D-transpeptidase catalytic domain/Putative peptidoglycan binding domain
MRRLTSTAAARTATLAGVATLATAGLLAPSALALTPVADPSQTVTTPVPPPPPDAVTTPLAGKAKISAEGGIATRKLRYVARGGVLEIGAAVRPFVPGQIAVLEVRRRGKVVGRKRARIRRAKRGAGKVVFEFKARRKGVYKARIRHRGSTEQKPFKSNAFRFKAVVLSAGEGARGTAVLLLQRGLHQLGYAAPVTGYYDAGTSRAVIAYRKVNGWERIGYASSTVYSWVLQGKGAFRPRFPDAGYHVEYDWSRQVLAFVRDGKPVNVYHSSSGAPATPTVFGTFSFYRKEPGTNGLGMVHSNYFIGGYAIHGYHSVPVYPASHGCLRVPVPNALQIDGQISLGMRIMVYV